MCIIIGLLCSYHAGCRTAAFQKKKKKKSLIDFVQKPANSFDVESGTEQRQSRESSSSNWKELNLCLSWECYCTLDALTFKEVVRNMGRKGYWRHVGFSRALWWLGLWHGAIWHKSREMLSEVAGRVGSFTFSHGRSARLCGVLSLYLMWSKLLWTRLKVCSHC